jgi:probable F420-dependent oxidoreductase
MSMAFPGGPELAGDHTIVTQNRANLRLAAKSKARRFFKDKSMSNEHPIRFGMWLDFRNPQQWERPWHVLWRELIDLVVWAETLGWDDVLLSEHHFTSDGYPPSPIVLASAIAARTTMIRIGQFVALLPLYHPVRLAEDGAMVDIISGGRFELGVGLGYRPEEYAGYGIPIASRGSRADEALQIIRHLWQGETVTFRGRHFQIENARLSPRPLQRPNPPIWIGGYTPSAYRRAARYGDGMVPAGNLEQAYEAYLHELRAAGKDVSHPRIASTAGGAMFFAVSNDPEKTWREMAPHVAYHINMYASWSGTTQSYPRIDDPAGLMSYPGFFTVVTPQEAVSRIKQATEKVPIERWYTMVRPPGYSMEKARENLELFATEVIPHFR